MEYESGIEGILKRLERQRRLSFGLRMRRNGGINHESRNLDKDEQSGGAFKDVGEFSWFLALHTFNLDSLRDFICFE